ncbi:hypothetical protein E1A91_D03G178000v1 [Gossypium mustelinum]|uniref:Prokaryotic-type class I peptide chain release factors domain-containing protein n=1 Tax=Gossypium mustelinum TaxID=34275 RepID=A0A5D2VPI9_GOSMU|nr:hypothetical protein E1A91_D03G178000v1 [Gossypium mustelinum]
MSVIRTSANMIMKQLLHHPPLSFISFFGRPLLPCSRNPIIRLTPNRGISCSPIRCAAPDADADRKVSARLSQMQQLLQEAEERASSAGNGPTPQITLDHVTVSFARSGGPGGQNVNKVNTKVDMRFNVKQAYWLSDRIRERIMQMAIIDASAYVPPPPSEEQKKKIAKMAAIGEQKRLKSKKVLSDKKAFRRSRDSWD